MTTFVKPNRWVNRVFLHCSASDNPAHDDVSVMRQWHLARGWSDVGYHYFIQKNGNIQVGRPIEKTPAAQAGNNKGTIAICLHGLEESKFTIEQFHAVFDFCRQINVAYGGNITFHGHREVAAKACPVFDYKRVLSLDSKGYMRRGGGSVTEPTPPPVDTGLSGLENDLPVLRAGDKSLAVAVLQQLLNDLDVDGHFGGGTKDAVVDYQRENGLAADGIVGRKTWESLAAD